MPNIETRAATAMTLITSADELTPWEVAWRQLAEARGNPFVTPDWYRSWLEHYDEDAEPFVIISCDSTGTCDGVLPLVRTGGSALRFAGADIGDQFHPACHESHELESTRRACAVLREHADEWSTAVFHGTEIDSDWLSGLRDGGSPLRVVTGLATAMPYVNLRELEWDTYWAERGRKLRKYVRSRSNQLSKNHDVTFRRSEDRSELVNDMTTMFELHERRFGRSSLLLDPRAQAFHRTFAEAASRHDWLRLAFMEIDGKPVAASYGWNVGGRYGDYNGGFHPDWAKTSVGLLLMVHTLRCAFEEGANEYDFLLGDESYKSRFSEDRRRVATVMAGQRCAP